MAARVWRAGRNALGGARLRRMCTCPSGEGVWALPPAASDAASAQLVAFPEWTAAEAALDAGKPGAALPELQRVVEVTTSMGPASPMAIAAQKRLVAAAFSAREYSIGRSSLVALHNALADAPDKDNMTDRVLTQLALSSLYLHLGDGAGASRQLVNLLSDIADVDDFAWATAVAHTRFIAAQAVSAGSAAEHYDPSPAREEAAAAWEALASRSEVPADAGVAEAGAAMAERNMAAYLYAVGKLNAAQPPLLGFGGDPALASMGTAGSSVDRDGDPNALLGGCVPATGKGAEEVAMGALLLVPGGSTYLPEGGEAPALSPGINHLGWELAQNWAQVQLQLLQEASDSSLEGATLQQAADKAAAAGPGLEAASACLRAVLSAQDEAVLRSYEEELPEVGVLEVPHTVLPEGHPCIARTLALLARTAAAGESAVTAEGLFRSALDKYKAGAATLHPYEAREWMFVGHQYAQLLSSWDKREGEAQALLKGVAADAMAVLGRSGARREGLSALPGLGSWDPSPPVPGEWM